MNSGAHDKAAQFGGVSRTLSSWLGVGVRQAIKYCLPSFLRKNQLLCPPAYAKEVPGMHIVFIFYAFLFAMLLVLIEVHRCAISGGDSGMKILRPIYSQAEMETLMAEDSNTDVNTGLSNDLEPSNSNKPGVPQPLPADRYSDTASFSSHLYIKTHETNAGIQQGSVFTSRDVFKGVRRNVFY